MSAKGISATANAVVGAGERRGGCIISSRWNDTGATAISTFCSAGSRAIFRRRTLEGDRFSVGRTDSIVAFGGGYSIEWSANSAANYIQPGGSSFAFTCSAETPAMFGAEF